MRFLLLNQTFFPDVAATAQHLAEVALKLVEEGHEVTVLTSRRAYDDPQKVFSPNETWRGVRIVRLASTGFGKGARWKRAADFASFLFACMARLVCLRRTDVVVALTTPPLISSLGACVALLWRARFVYWVMDFNPDEAIAAGWLKPGSLAAWVLERISRFSLRQAQTIIALDRYMRERILLKGIDPGKVLVLPPASCEPQIHFDEYGRSEFRKRHGLEDKFVVMYSGNHSPCHPLGTIMAAADKLQPFQDIVFLFVGGGSEWGKIAASVSAAKPNVRCLPYQPLSQLSASLSGADLHLVVMGDSFVGLVHPCKIYNIIKVGAPVLYVGPSPSHISDLLAGSSYPSRMAAHGQVDEVVRAVREFRDNRHSLPAVSRKVHASLSPKHQKSNPFQSLIDILTCSSF